MRSKMSFKTESGNVLDKLKARSIELRKDQKKNNNGGGNNIKFQLKPLPRGGLQQL